MEGEIPEEQEEEGPERVSMALDVCTFEKEKIAYNFWGL